MSMEDSPESLSLPGPETEPSGSELLLADLLSLSLSSCPSLISSMSLSPSFSGVLLTDFIYDY